MVRNLPGKSGKPIFIALLMLFFALLFLLPACGKKDKKPDDPQALNQPTPQLSPKDLPKPELPPTAAPGPPQWAFGSNEISFKVKADAMLNSFMDQPHTLLLCVYQFSAPNAFQDLAKTEDGLLKLLECQRFNDTVTAVDRLIFQPGESRTVFLDRAAGSQYVAVAAGYYALDPQKVTMVFKVPVEVIPKGTIFKKNYQLPGRLDVELYLGPSGIQQVKKD